MARTPKPPEPPVRRRLTPTQPAPVTETPLGGAGVQADRVDTPAVDAESARVDAVRAFLGKALTRFRTCADADATHRKLMAEDWDFYTADQWPDEIRASREGDQRPCLTINRLPQFVRQVTNQQREARPAGQIGPVDSGADIDTAEVLQGIVRHIEQNSDGEIAYTTAGEHQAIMGRGYWRLLADYPTEDSMAQEVQIRAVPDPFVVYLDPARSRVEGSDARFGFIVEDVPLDEYRELYPTSEVASLTSFTGYRDQSPDWLPEGKVRVADYYYLETTQEDLAQIQIGAGPLVTVPRASVNEADVEAGRLRIVKTRTTTRTQLKYAKINAVEVLDGNEAHTAGRSLPGRYIPIIEVLGERLVANGKQVIRGMVRDAKDPQRAYNFWTSAVTESIALAPRAPYVGAEGQFEGHELEWDSANTRNLSRLEYKPVALGDQLAPPPQRNVAEPAIQAQLMALQRADVDLKAVTGLFDASQESSPEQSGKAILARQRQGELGNSHFMSNLARSIQHTVRILLDWIPVYYDVPRVLRILGVDGQPASVVVHAGHPDAAQQVQQQAQSNPLLEAVLDERIYDLSVGRYDVTISTQPSYQSRRQEAVESLVQLLQTFPQAFPVVADVLAQNMDWPGAQTLAKRFAAMLPPQAKEAADPNAVPPEAQTQIQALTQQLAALQQTAQQQAAVISSKAQELAAQVAMKQADLASRERIAAMQEQGVLLQTEAKIRGEAALTAIQARLDLIAQQVQQAHDVGMAAHDAVITPPTPMLTGPAPNGAAAAGAPAGVPA